MLGLWFMAAQLRACHCRACLRATRIAARRPTTSTANHGGRRKVLASDVFTACYTAIMATAAVIDAARKDRRRRELDREIAEARSSLARLLEESYAPDLARSITAPYHDASDGRPLEKSDVLRSICSLRLEDLREIELSYEYRDRAVRQLRTGLGIRDWVSKVPVATSSLAKCQEILAYEDEHPGVVQHRETRTDLHFARTNEMINDLVDLLQTRAYEQSELEFPGSHPSLDSPDSARTQIRLLRSDGYPSYTHPEADSEEAFQARARLNEVNLEILAGWWPYHRERSVAQICYNLLVCSVPPAIHNFNALILGFAQLGEHSLAQAVVDSFLYKSHLRPTEGTFLCLLHHYRLKRDIVGFGLLLRRLFGHDNRGIGLRRRTADEVAQIRRISEWAATANVNEVDGYYVECAELNQNLAEAIMEGLIDFGMLCDAAKLLAICLQEKWAVSREILKRLFHACISSLDGAAVKVLIQGFLDNIGQLSAMLLGPDPISPSMVRQLRHLLNIFRARRLPVDDGSQLPANTTGPSSEPRLAHLATAIWIRETWNTNLILNARLKRVQAAFSEERPLSARLDLAEYVLRHDAKRPVRKLADAEQIQRVAKLDWLVAEYVATTKTIRATEREIYDALATQTLRQELQTWQQFNPGAPIEEGIDMAIRNGTSGAMQQQVAARSQEIDMHHQLVACYARSQGIDMQLKAALREVLPPPPKDTDDVSVWKLFTVLERHLKALQDRWEEAEDRWEEAEPAAPTDPFSILLESLTKPRISILKTAPSTAAAWPPGQTSSAETEPLCFENRTLPGRTAPSTDAASSSGQTSSAETGLLCFKNRMLPGRGADGRKTAPSTDAETGLLRFKNRMLPGRGA
ncbi:hypothetical protein VTK56DRAFT_8718 [Thermocarpiscus australiensis]